MSSNYLSVDHSLSSLNCFCHDLPRCIQNLSINKSSCIISHDICRCGGHYVMSIIIISSYYILNDICSHPSINITIEEFHVLLLTVSLDLHVVSFNEFIVTLLILHISGSSSLIILIQM